VLKLYIVVAATERTTTDSYWEGRMSNPTSKSKDDKFTVIKLKFLREDMGHDSSSLVLVNTALPAGGTHK